MIVLKRLFPVFLTIAILMLIITGVEAQTEFSANDTSGCSDFHVKFTISSPSISSSDIVKWFFGTGDTITITGKDTMSMIFTRAGHYTVVVVVNNGTPAVKENYIIVHEALNAFFRPESFGVGNNYMFVPYASITDPDATYRYMWSYKDSTTGTTIRNQLKIANYTDPSNAIDSFTFSKGLYKIKLRILDNYGCSSSWEIPLIVADSIRLPNVFVPDRMEYYEIDPKDIGIVLHFQVYNRYGLLVYEEESNHILWNGKTFSGKELYTGVYYYILKASQGDLSGKYTQKGFIHLFRTLP